MQKKEKEEVTGVMICANWSAEVLRNVHTNAE
jgi:hypothetical protein